MLVQRALGALEQPDCDNVLCPGIVVLIGFGRMIEDTLAAEDVFSYLGINEVIQDHQQPTIGFRGW